METDLIGPRINAPLLPPAFTIATQLPANSRLFVVDRRGDVRLAFTQGVEHIPDGMGGLTPAYKLAGEGLQHIPVQNVVDSVGTEIWDGRDIVASPKFSVATEASYKAPGNSGVAIKPS